jgi:hypothetical protein
MFLLVMPRMVGVAVPPLVPRPYDVLRYTTRVFYPWILRKDYLGSHKVGTRDPPRDSGSQYEKILSTCKRRRTVWALWVYGPVHLITGHVLLPKLICHPLLARRREGGTSQINNPLDHYQKIKKRRKEKNFFSQKWN